MNIGELIDELSEYDRNIPIDIVVSVFKCSCDSGYDSYCYCTSEDIKRSISVEKEYRNVDKKGYTKEVVAVTLRGE